MPVKPAPTTTTVERPGDIRADQFTTKRQHEAIIGQDLPSTACCHGYLLFCDVDRLNLGRQMVDTYRIEHLAERNCDITKVDLVIPDANVVISVAVDDQYLNFG